MNECPRQHRFFPRCRFEPRYDLSPAQMPERLTSIKSANQNFWEQFRQETYVHDVCIRCGRVVKRVDK